MNKQQILNNLQLLRSAVEAQPEQLFDLHRFKQEKSCGSCFCTAGLAASMPEFQAQGMGIDPGSDNFWNVTVDGLDLWQMVLDEDFEDVYASPNADRLFGENSAENLFQERWQGLLDAEVFDDTEDDSPITDKQLAIYRLDKQIELVEAL